MACQSTATIPLGDHNDGTISNISVVDKGSCGCCCKRDCCFSHYTTPNDNNIIEICRNSFYLSSSAVDKKDTAEEDTEKRNGDSNNAAIRLSIDPYGVLNWGTLCQVPKKEFINILNHYKYKSIVELAEDKFEADFTIYAQPYEGIELYEEKERQGFISALYEKYLEDTGHGEEDNGDGDNNGDGDTVMTDINNDNGVQLDDFSCEGGYGGGADPDSPPSSSSLHKNALGEVHVDEGEDFVNEDGMYLLIYILLSELFVVLMLMKYIILYYDR